MPTLTNRSPSVCRSVIAAVVCALALLPAIAGGVLDHAPDGAGATAALSQTHV